MRRKGQMEQRSEALATPDQLTPADANGAGTGTGSGGASATGTAGGGEVKAGVLVGGGK
jgi:hypothetical protein